MTSNTGFFKKMSKSYALTYGVIGFMLGRLELFGIVNPIIIGYVSVFCFKSGFYPILIASALGLISIAEKMYSVRYIIALGIMCAIHIIGNDRYKQSCVGGLSVLTGGLIFAMYYDFSLLFAMLAVVEAVLAAALNVILRENISALNVIDTDASRSSCYARDIQRITGERLKTLSAALERAAKSCSKAYMSAAAENAEEDKREIFDRVTEISCKDCANVEDCWSKNCVRTYKAVYNAISEWLDKGRADKDALGGLFMMNCPRYTEITAAADGYVKMYRDRKIWRERMKNIKYLTLRQLANAGRVIGELKESMTENLFSDAELSTRIYKALTSNMVKSVAAFRITGRLEIFITLEDCHGCDVCRKSIIPSLKELLDMEFISLDDDCVTEDRSCVLHLAEKPLLRLNVYSCGVHKTDSDISGDSYTNMPLESGKHLIALADGMGSGETAREESAASIEMYEDFMTAGFDRETILESINSVLLMDEGKECFSTLDVCTFDLYTGTAEFIKIGAVSTLIARGREVEILRASSLPVGILGEVDREIFTKNLAKGDVIVMMTDGVLDSRGGALRNEDWVADILKRRRNNHPGKIARSILARAEDNCKGYVKDDMTVLVAVVC